MKTIVNRSRLPLKIRLSGGKILHLGPGREGQIGTRDADRESLLKLVEAGKVEILGDSSKTGGGGGSSSGPAPDTHGHHPNTAVKRRGER